MYDNFVNKAGIKLPLREYLYSLPIIAIDIPGKTITVEGNQVSKFYADCFLNISDNTGGTYTDQVDNATPAVYSGGNTIITMLFAPNSSYLNGTVTTDILEVYYGGKWTQVPKNQYFPHELYFAEFYDDKTYRPMLIMVGGTSYLDTWLGGVATVDSITVDSVTLVENPSQYTQLGNGSFWINGIQYDYTSVSGNTLVDVIPSPIGNVNAGDILVSSIGGYSLQYLMSGIIQVGALDICCTLNNHVFYGSYTSRLGYISNSFGAEDSVILTSTATSLDDLVIDGDYSNSLQENLRFTITSIPNEPQVMEYLSASTNLNAVQFGYGPNQGGQSGNGGHTYSVTITGSGTQFTWKLDSGSPTSPIALSTTPITLANNVTVVFAQTTGYTDGDTFVFTVGNASNTTHGNEDYYTVESLEITGTAPNLTTGQYVQIQAPTPISTPFVHNGVTFSFQIAIDGYPYGHKVGDTWTVECTPDVIVPWANIFSDINARRPGQGGIVYFDSAPVAFIPQEQFMYVADRNGVFETVHFQLSADLLNESIIPNRLKTDTTNKPLRMELISNTKDSVMIMNVENELIELGRVENIQETPMVTIISRPIKNDFSFIPFVQNNNGIGNGTVNYADNKVFVTAPSVGLWYMWDDYYQIWQPPQTGNFSSISVIDGQICAHSSIKN